MSFINLAKSGFNNMTDYGKLIGTGKNNGIKVYEKIQADGKRVLSSFDKEGNGIKQVKRSFPTPYDMHTTSRNSQTGVVTSSKTALLSNDGRVFYEYTKTTPVEECSYTNIDSFQLSKQSDTFLNKKSLQNVRRTQVDAFQDKSNINYVDVSQTAPDKSSFRFSYYPIRKEAVLDSAENFKMNDSLVLKNGESRYDDINGSLLHASKENVHESNIAQTLYDGLKQIWTK